MDNRSISDTIQSPVCLPINASSQFAQGDSRQSSHLESRKVFKENGAIFPAEIVEQVVCCVSPKKWVQLRLVSKSWCIGSMH